MLLSHPPKSSSAVTCGALNAAIEFEPWLDQSQSAAPVVLFALAVLGTGTAEACGDVHPSLEPHGLPLMADEVFPTVEPDSIVRVGALG